MVDLHSGTSPLLECPCTDRIGKKTVQIPVLLTAAQTCEQTVAIPTASSCTAAVGNITNVTSSRTVSNVSLPSGCLLLQGQQGDAASAIFNTAATQVDCDFTGSKTLYLSGESVVDSLNMRLEIRHDGTDAQLSLTGPDGSWFGVGFDAQAMSDAPYALIVDGHGAVTERRLATHDPGSELQPSISVISSSASDGVRKVVLSRKVDGATEQHYSLPREATQINLIVAIGNTVELAYHKARTASKVVLLPVDTPACVCEPLVEHYLVYNNATQNRFGYECTDEPRGDMLRKGDGTGRAVANAACNIDTYHGGTECCKHSFLLTDQAQESLIQPDKVDRYFLKFRVYFQVFRPPTAASAASHQHLHHWVFLIDAQINDYEEDNAHYGQASVGKITAHITADQFCDSGCDAIGTGVQPGPEGRLNFTTLTPLVITPHCHAPSCIREELWNDDTGEILCNVTARYGTSDEIFNERGYAAISPCIFGHQPGLQTPFSLAPIANIRAVKYFNNTYRHVGQMAQWTGLAVYT
mmetsp:Transcript_12506/g.31977  ORF Transcript_12506/g.31977 Transcript_12506/m.31977 type:complete len:525 (-) Transcript_12506:459-2033(-)